MFFLFASLLILFAKSRTRLETILGYVMLIFAFDELKDILHLVPAVAESTYWMTLLFTIDMWTVAICSVFIFEMVTPRRVTVKRVLSVGSIFMIFTIAYAVTGNIIVLYTEMGFIALFCTYVASVMFRSLRYFNRYLEDNYSNFENISLNWLAGVISVWVVCLALWTLCYFYREKLIYILYYSVSLAGWGVLFVYTRRHVEVPMDEGVKEPAVCGPSGSDEACSMQGENDIDGLEDVTKPVICRESLEKLMTDDKLYMNSRLTLNDLALALGTNRTYLSAYLNRELALSFYDYVNSFRIETACRIADEHQGMVVSEIAERSGFNSVSTFRRAFLREKGFSFGEYRRNQTKNAQ